MAGYRLAHSEQNSTLRSALVVTFLWTHTDRQSVLLFVCLFVCLLVSLHGYGFLRRGKSNGVKFCTAVRRRFRQGISHFGEVCSPPPRSPKSAGD